MAEHKLPVFETIGASYRFVFGNLVPIFKVCAIPFAVLAVASYFYSGWALQQQIDALKATSSAQAMVRAMMESVSGTFLFAAVANLVQAALVGFAAVALHRMVLFGEHNPRLSAGPMDMRFVGLSVGAVVAFGLVGALYFGVIAGAMQTGTNPVVVLPAAVAVLVIMIFSLRLVQMFPIVVAEGRISFARSWELTRGNWWRIFWSYLLAFLPFMLVVTLVVPVLLGQPLIPTPPRDLDDWRTLLEKQHDALPLSVFVNFLIGIISTALGVALLSFGYKKLNGQDFHAVLTQAA